MAAKTHKELVRFGGNLSRAYRRTHGYTGQTDFLRLVAANRLVP